MAVSVPVFGLILYPKILESSVRTYANSACNRAPKPKICPELTKH